MDMRKLKFRAWDDKAKKWLHGYEYLGGCSIVGEIILTGNWLSEVRIQDLNSVIIDQFTGLFDKKGQEIYENDILHIVRYEGKVQTRGKVFMKKGAFRVQISPDASTSTIGSYNPGIITVIGNVHENSDLLVTDTE
jgi:uncharacterized phage protein (TIGR01671 family)